MIKKIIVGVLVLAIVVLAGWKLLFDKTDVSKKIADVSDNLIAYHMEATMDVSNNDEVKSYFVITDYQKNGEQDNFRISLLDKGINQEQILIRNDQGVFVLTPLLNQVYKFKGNYPLNGPKPYLYHSMLEVFKSDHDIKSISDGYLLSSKPNYENSPAWAKQDIKLSKDFKPVWVNIYNSNNEIVCKVTFSKVDLNPTFEEGYFDVNKNMEKAKANASTTSVLIDESDLPFLPTNAPMSSTLKETTSATIEGKTVYILSYEGAKAFTVVQSIVDKAEEVTQIEVNGSFVDQLFGITYQSGYNMTYIYNGVSHQIYSKDLTLSEMIMVAQSMEEITVKE